MKKNNRLKKLSLSRETLHRLDDEALGQVNGGFVTVLTVIVSKALSCQKTNGSECCEGTNYPNTVAENTSVKW